MDIKTMLFALALGNLSLCAALFFHEYEQKKSLTLSTWALAKQLQAAAWLLLYFGGSGVVPDLITIPVGYAILFTGVAVEGGALWEAVDRPGWRRFTIPCLVLAVLLFLGSYLFDEGGVRIVAGSLLLGGFYMSSVAALASNWPSATMLRRFLVVSMGLLALMVAVRGVLVLLTPEGWGWVSNTLVQVLTSTAFYLLMLLNGFGYLLLSREQLQNELTRIAVIDPLTNVHNRRGFFNVLAPWMSLARRPGLPTALVLLDLDQFKRVNDSYGHPAGDTVLRAVVDVCKHQLRDSDQLGRLVGVQFALLLPRTSLPDAALVAERIRAAIEATPVKSERAMISMTVSIGVTTIRADDSTISLFKRADEALETAKVQGRNRVIEAPAPPPAE
jgi:diguanylate cyclase (GGDEF)-like protein